MRRRAPVPAASMTSLLDVLFIVVFASLVYTASLAQRQQAEGSPAAEPDAVPLVPPPDAGAPGAPPDHAALHERALASVREDVLARRPLFVRVDEQGTIRAIEEPVVAGAPPRSLAMGVPLMEKVTDPDVVLAYLGDRSADLRLCSVVKLRLDVPDLSGVLVVIAPDVPLTRLKVALARGLRRDAERCLADQRGVAVVVSP